MAERAASAGVRMQEAEKQDLAAGTVMIRETH
jgi:hypothetical protein